MKRKIKRRKRRRKGAGGEGRGEDEGGSENLPSNMVVREVHAWWVEGAGTEKGRLLAVGGTWMEVEGGGWYDFRKKKKGERKNKKEKKNGRGRGKKEADLPPPPWHSQGSRGPH